jgi:hypothetical protein
MGDFFNASMGVFDGRFGPVGVRVGDAAPSGLTHYGEGVGIIAVRTVPEPASWLLAALASAAVFSVGTRRRNAAGKPQWVRTVALFHSSAAPLLHLLWIGLLFGLAAPPAHAQTLEWVQSYGTPRGEFGEDYSNGVSADGLGHVYTASFRWYQLPSSICTPGPGQGENCADQDAAITKLDAAGNLLWTQQLGTYSRDSAWAVSADGLGNVYLAGDTLGSLGGPNAGGTDSFVSKYDAAGNRQWTRQLGSSRQELTNGVVADDLGNVYISGQTRGDLGGPHSPGTYDSFLGKHDEQGNLQWIRQLPGSSDDVQSGVSADELGNVFLLGDNFVAKFDAAGDLQWNQPLLWPEGRSLSADGRGNVYVAGILGTQFLSDYVSKFAEDGSLEWTRLVGRAENDYGNVYGVSADGHGNVYVTGYDNSGAFIRKYDEFGQHYWTDHFDMPVGYGISADGLGNMYVAGMSYANFDRNEFVAKYFENPEQQPPVVRDRFGTADQGELFVFQFLTGQGTEPITYHDLVVTGPSGASPVNAPMLSSSGELRWQTTTTDFLGLYEFDVTATNAFGSDTGRLTLHLQIPEPATWLLATILAAFFAVHRKRTHAMPCTLVAAFALVFLTTTSAPVHAETLDGKTVRTSF